MSSLFWMKSTGAPTDAQSVRRTATPYYADKEPAEASRPPDFNETVTDPDPSIGLATRGVAGDYVEKEKAPPFWETGEESSMFTHLIDRQVSTSGTAAQRESAGQWGHGTLPATFSMEPTVRDGGALGNDYFMREERSVQASGGREMEDMPDRDDRVALSQTGAMRDSVAASRYADFYNAVVGQ